MADDWWTGSADAGLRRALAMGAPPPPGSLPPEMMNEYRMARASPESGGPGGNFDVARGLRRPAATRDDVLAGWQARDADLRRQEEAQRERDYRSEMKSLLYGLTGRRRKKKRTMQDAGDALARA